MTFLDTNVLVYLYDEGTPTKRRTAARILAETKPAVISTQVLREFYSVCRGKLRRSHEAVHQNMQDLLRLHVARLTPESVVKAADLVPAHSLSIWDAMIVRAAYEAGRDRILTEDMRNGAVIEGLRIEDPFAGA